MKNLIIILIFLIGCGETIKKESIVIDKIYIPYRSGTGVGISSRGSVVTTFESESEKYLLFFKEDDEIINMQVNANIYFSIEKGNRFQYWKTWSGRSFIQKSY